MLAPPSAGFRRLLPLLKPHRNTLLAGGLCMLVFVACWPLLAWLAAKWLRCSDLWGRLAAVLVALLMVHYMDVLHIL